MNVSLSKELEQFIQKKVKSGSYNSASEVVRDALRLLIEQEKLTEVRLAGLRNKIDKGFAQSELGEMVDGELVLREVNAIIEKHRRRKQQ